MRRRSGLLHLKHLLLAVQEIVSKFDRSLASKAKNKQLSSSWYHYHTFLVALVSDLNMVSSQSVLLAFEAAGISTAQIFVSIHPSLYFMVIHSLFSFLIQYLIHYPQIPPYFIP